MANASAFIAAQHYTPAETLHYRSTAMPARFGDLREEYRTTHATVSLFDRSDRGLVILTGRDRKSWLHNLVTNSVKTLDDNAGNYAFATDVKGRVQFDLNILCLPDALWLDIDRATIPAAVQHLEHYLITEDVQICDSTAAHARLGCAGPRAGDIAAGLGAPNFPALAALSSLPLADTETPNALGSNGSRIVRHDFPGLPGFEVIVPAERATAWWDRLAAAGARPAGFRTLDVLRIEAGIPWLGRDIDDRVLPPETGQIERGISYQKGCYLGQEVIERMRSHGALARRLVRLRLAASPALEVPVDLCQHGRTVGRITSLAAHPIETYRVGLGYLQTRTAAFYSITAGEPAQMVTLLT